MRKITVADGPHVEWVIGKDGEVTCEVKGITGPTCTTLTAKTEKALGVVISRTLKPEHYANRNDKTKA